MNAVHTKLAEGRWYSLTLAQQLGNIGSEVSRAEKAKDKDAERFRRASERALELFDLTLADPRHHAARGRLREVARAREVFCDALLGGKEYKSTLHDLQKYFDQFALYTRNTL